MTALGREVRVRRYPAGPVTVDDFEVVDVPVPEPGPGQVLVRNTWTSVDPGLRLRLRPDAPAGYFAAFPLDRPMDGIMAVGSVVASRAEGFEVGDLVTHALGWRDYSVVDAGVGLLGGVGTLRKVAASGSVEPQWHLGPLGGMGLTAYAGLHVVDALKGGETVWVSAAAGAVGSLVAQIAKLCGHRVIASAGTDQKVAWLREELGVEAFNYRNGLAGLSDLAPDGIDVYFDSVGGDHLEFALDHLHRGGRIAICGSISEYESESKGPRNLFLSVSKDLTLRGFRGSSNLHLLDEMQQRVGGWLRSGSLVHRETVFDGLDQAPRALVEMLAGRTIGKTLVRITPGAGAGGAGAASDERRTS